MPGGDSLAVVTGAGAGALAGGTRFFGVAASFCGGTGLIAVAAPTGFGVALAAKLAFSTGLKVW